MTKIKLPIKDNLFSHVKCSSLVGEPKLFDWDRDDDNLKDYVFLTDSHVHMVDSFSNKKKYAWLLESPDIETNAHEFVKNNPDKFDLIFTSRKDILSTINHSKFLVFGSCWINYEDRGLHFESKNKLISMVSSGRAMTSGHILRNNIANSYKNNIDLFGRAYNPIDNKITSLKNYMFQIVVENNKSDYYFTEKLIDCLQTGVIPIYWGCPSIGDFFDTNGILSFDTIEDLEKIISTLSKELYLSKKESIEKNFEESKKYTIAEDYLTDHYSEFL